MPSSLQEVAPLSYSFIGSYFLTPYYARFEEALDLASAQVQGSTRSASLSTSTPQSSSADHGEDVVYVASATAETPYTLVRAHNVGMTAIMLFARDPSAIRRIEEAECGFGAADMGNKGAVGLRVLWGGRLATATTELTFVATHLAAMEWNTEKRNANWRSIVAGLTFANPRTVLPGVFPPDHSAPPPDRSGAGDTQAPSAERHGLARSHSGTAPVATESGHGGKAEEEADASRPLLSPVDEAGTLLHPDHPNLTAAHHAALQDMSIFKPSSHLFLAGDLNYRIASTAPPPLATFPSFDPRSEHYYDVFLPRDQLSQERLAGKTLHGLTEAPVRFGPTYKYHVLSGSAAAGDVGAASDGAAGGQDRPVDGVPEVRWRFAPHRWPGWCDRVLYLDVPPWVSASAAPGAREPGRDGQGRKVEVLAYDALPVVATSDHRAVFLRARVPVISPEAMRCREDGGGRDPGVAVEDPRLVLPVPIDVHAWERRAAARRREVVVGWSALLWSTGEGAVFLGTVLLVGVGSWWLWSLWS